MSSSSRYTTTPEERVALAGGRVLAAMLAAGLSDYYNDNAPLLPLTSPGYLDVERFLRLDFDFCEDFRVLLTEGRSRWIKMGEAYAQLKTDRDTLIRNEKYWHRPSLYECLEKHPFGRTLELPENWRVAAQPLAFEVMADVQAWMRGEGARVREYCKDLRPDYPADTYMGYPEFKYVWECALHSYRLLPVGRITQWPVHIGSNSVILSGPREPVELLEEPEAPAPIPEAPLPAFASEEEAQAFEIDPLYCKEQLAHPQHSA